MTASLVRPTGRCASALSLPARSVARLPFLLRTPTASPVDDARGRLAQAAAAVTGVAAARLGRLAGPARPLVPSATLADLRRLVGPIGADAVEVDLTEVGERLLWPVIAVRAVDAAPVAVPAGAPMPQGEFEAVGYAVLPTSGHEIGDAPRERGLCLASVALGAAAGAALGSGSPLVTAGLVLATLAGFGLLHGRALALDLHRWLGAEDRADEEAEADGLYQWLVDDDRPGRALASRLWTWGALGLAGGLTPALTITEIATALGGAVAAFAAASRGRRRTRTRRERLVEVEAGHLLDALADLRLLGLAERARQSWHDRYAEALGDARRRRWADTGRSVALALLVAGAALTTSGLALLAALAALTAGWTAAEGLAAPARRLGERPGSGPPCGTNGIEVEGAAFGHGALGIPSLSVPEGGLCVVVGAAGAGKSRLLGALLGAEPLVRGRGCVGGVDLGRPGGADAVGRVACVLLQDAPLHGGDVASVVLGDRLEAEPAREAWPALDAVGLGGTVRALPMGLLTLVASGGDGFSGGQRRRLAVAAALARQVPICLLDEPLAGLDADARRVVWDAIRRDPATRLVVTRDAALAASADVAYHVADGRLRPLAATG